MHFSKDWGSTTTALAFINLGVSTFLVYTNHITATDWMALNALGSAAVGGKGIIKKIKINGQEIVADKQAKEG